MDRWVDIGSGVGGPIHVTNQYHANHCTNVWINAAIDSGIPFNTDYNAAQQDGVCKAQVLVHNGTRIRYHACYHLIGRSATSASSSSSPSPLPPSIVVLIWYLVDQRPIRSTSSGYLHAATDGKTKQPTIVTHAHVTRILLDRHPSCGRIFASGVEYVHVAENGVQTTKVSIHSTCSSSCVVGGAGADNVERTCSKCLLARK
jgi:choline dehydrogenase-like flavoprotein